MEPFESPKLDLDDDVSVSIAAKKRFQHDSARAFRESYCRVCHVDLQQSLGM